MKSSKLILLLQSLSEDEMRGLAKFVRSPFYNSNEGVIRLFDYLRKFHPQFSDPKLEKEKVFRKVIPEETYNDRRMRVLMFRLSDLVEEFLVVQQLKYHPFQHQKYLLDALQSRKLFGLFEKKHAELETELERESLRDINYYEEKWHLQHRRIFSLHTVRNKTAREGLQDTLHKLDAFYILSKLRYAGELLNRKNIYAEQHEIPLLKEIRQLVRQHPAYAADQVFQIYADILLLMEHHLDEAVFERLKDNCMEYLHVFRPADQSVLLRHLINSSIQLYHHGRLDYLHTQFELYEIGLKNDLFLVGGQLPEATFLNISITGTVLKKTEWVQTFIENYYDLLPKNRRQNATALARAYLFFAREHYLPSIGMLQQIHVSNARYTLRVKSLSLRNYYELSLQDPGYYDLLLSESKSFEKFVRRSANISPQRSKAYLNYITFLRKLGKNQFGNPRFKKNPIQALKLELEQTNDMIAKLWLMEKVEQLLSRSTF